tara:strand:+ start:710 stop:1111 length:402 start_codon:yes stop_codon:yes gene_type:complete
MERKLKPSHLRKPEESIVHNDLVSIVQKETGYAKVDIQDCINAYLLAIKNELLERKKVTLRHIGTLYPMVQPPRKVTNMGGIRGENYTRMTMDARWQIKFQTEKNFVREVRDIMVTKRDLDKIYYKNKNDGKT